MYNYTTYPIFSNGGEPDWIWRVPRTPNEKYNQFLRELNELKAQKIYQNKPLTFQQRLTQMGFKPSDIRGAGPNFYKLHSDLDLINARLKHQALTDPRKAKLMMNRFFKGHKPGKYRMGYDTQGLANFLKHNHGRSPNQIFDNDFQKFSNMKKPINPLEQQYLEMLGKRKPPVNIADPPWSVTHNQVTPTRPTRWSRFVNSPFMKTVGKVAKRLDPFPWMIAPIMHPNQYQYQMPAAMRRGGQIKK